MSDDTWACVEIFGHRKHYGRIVEVEWFGSKMLQIDIPEAEAAPLFGMSEIFTTLYYGGASIFSLTPMTEEAARAWARRQRTTPGAPLSALPPPEHDIVEDDYHKF